MISNIWSMGDAGVAYTVNSNVNINTGDMSSQQPNVGPMLIDLDATHKLLGIGSGALGFDVPADTTILWVIDLSTPTSPVIGPSFTMNIPNGDSNGIVGAQSFDVLPSAHSFYYFYADLFSRLVLSQFTWSPSTLAISFGSSQLIGGGAGISNVVVLNSSLLVTALSTGGSPVWQKWPLTAGAIGATTGTLALAPPSSSLAGYVGLVINNSGGGQDIVQFYRTTIGGNPAFTMQAILPSGANGSVSAAVPVLNLNVVPAWSQTDMTDQFYLLRANPASGVPGLTDLYLATVNPSTGNITTSLVHGGGATGVYPYEISQYWPSPVLSGVSPAGTAGWAMFEEATRSLSSEPVEAGIGGAYDPNYLFPVSTRFVSNPRSWDSHHFVVATMDWTGNGGLSDLILGNVSIRLIELALQPIFYPFVTNFQFEVTARINNATRQFPREDALALGGRRLAGTTGNDPTSAQSSIRQAPKVYS